MSSLTSTTNTTSTTSSSSSSSHPIPTFGSKTTTSNGSSSSPSPTDVVVGGSGPVILSEDAEFVSTALINKKLSDINLPMPTTFSTATGTGSRVHYRSEATITTDAGSAKTTASGVGGSRVTTWTSGGVMNIPGAVTFTETIYGDESATAMGTTVVISATATATDAAAAAITDVAEEDFDDIEGVLGKRGT